MTLAHGARSARSVSSPESLRPAPPSRRYVVILALVASAWPLGTGASTIHYRADASQADLRTGAISLRRNVVAWGDEFSMHAAWGTYRLDPEEIILGGGVRGTWRADSARCTTARVSPADSTVELWGGVFLAGGDGSELTCARLLYRDRDGVAALAGPVALRDSTRTYHARADTGWYWRGRDELHLARQCTLLIHVSQAEPIRVASDSVRMGRAGGAVTASGSVVIFSPDVEGTCDTVSFLQDDDAVVLTGEPSLSGHSLRCRAKRITLQRREGQLRHLVLEGEAWAARTGDSPADSLWDQTWGDRMVVWLSGGQPSRLTVTGSATARHRVTDRDGVFRGTNDAEGDSIILSIGRGVLTGVRISGGAHGTYHPASGESGLPGEALDYASRTLSYEDDEGVLSMDGQATLTSGSARLTADSVRYSPAHHDMVATGGAVLRDGTQEVKGDVMTFDVARRQGVVREGSTKFEEAFSLGRRVARIDSKRLSIAGGRFTTCDRDCPHFYITSPTMRVELDNKVVARSLVLWIHDVPVLYLPYWIFPIRRDRHSGFLMPSFSVRNVLGLSGSRAGIAGFGYYAVLGDYADAELSLDWNEGLGWTVNATGNYALRYRIPSGSLNFSYARRAARAEWILREQHQQNLPRGWRLTANVNATRSKPFIDQETWDAQDRLDQQAGLSSHVTLDKRFAEWSLRGSLRREQNWTTVLTESTSTTTETITSVLPEVVISRPSKALFGSAGTQPPWFKAIYASFGTTLRNRIVESDVPGSLDGASTGAVHAVQLSWQLPRLFRKIAVSPQAAFHETWIARGVAPASGPRLTGDRYGVLHDIGIAASTKLYGLWRPPFGRIEAVRHVVSPQVSFGYTPDWFVRGWDFRVGHFSAGDGAAYGSSGFGSVYAKSRRVSMSVGNVFQVKLRKGDTVIKNDNLANLTLSTGYDFERKEKNGDPWSPLGSTLTLSPGRGLSWSLTTTHDPNRSMGFVSSTSTISARLEGGWARPTMRGRDGETLGPFRGTWGIAATHSYSHRRGYADEPQTLRVDLRLAPTRGWDARASLNYDVTRGRAMNKSLSLVRDLHCWQAEFTWYQAANQWHYLFRAFVRAYPQSLFVKHEERG